MQPTGSERRLNLPSHGTQKWTPLGTATKLGEKSTQTTGMFLSGEGAPAVLRQKILLAPLPIICFSHFNNEASS